MFPRDFGPIKGKNAYLHHGNLQGIIMAGLIVWIIAYAIRCFKGGDECPPAPKLNPDKSHVLSRGLYLSLGFE